MFYVNILVCWAKRMKICGHIHGQTKGQKPSGTAALGFLALGLALDVALGLPLENPLGDLQSSP
jgi:hypothetical protein